ncbi:MAG: hypothetical protein ACKVRP_04390 [Bacteroidota bacterium]
MNPPLRDTVARLILAAYVLAGVLLEVGHNDVHDIMPNNVPVLSSHHCGDKEIHIPLDTRDECLACVQSTLRVATAATDFPTNTNATFCLAHIPASSDRTLHTDLFHSGTRGPPRS